MGECESSPFPMLMDMDTWTHTHKMHLFTPHVFIPCDYSMTTPNLLIPAHGSISMICVSATKPCEVSCTTIHPWSSTEGHQPGPLPAWSCSAAMTPPHTSISVHQCASLVGKILRSRLVVSKGMRTYHLDQFLLAAGKERGKSAGAWDVLQGPI